MLMGATEVAVGVGFSLRRAMERAGTAKRAEMMNEERMVNV